MGLCSVSDVGVLTGVTEAMLGDDEVEALIAFSDAQINDDLGVQSEPAPIRIRHLSALLTAIKIYTRPDFRQGFHVGEVIVTEANVEEALNRWMRDVNRIYAFYGCSVQETPMAFKVA